MARLDIQRTHDGSVEHLQLRPGENRVQVRPGHQFRLDRSEVDPELLRVLKVDSDLVIEGIPLGAAAAVTPDDATALPEGATVVLEGYYRVCSASDRCTVTVDDGTADATAVAGGELGSTGLVLADVGTQPLGALSDGNFVLYDPKFEAPILPMLADGSARPLLYGLGGAAVLGLALGGGGGGGGDSGLPPQGNISLELKSSNYFNNRFPTISGTAQPGSDVQVRIDTDGDQRANVTYTTKADASGNWSVNLRSATPSSGELPAAGLSDSNTMEVVGMHNGVQSILPVTTLTFDDTPPAKAEISQVAGDNIINGGERDNGVTFSGTSEANGTVELKVGNTTRLVPVDANGNWSTTLGKDDLPAADGEYTVTVTSMDAAGNRGPEATTLITMNTSGKQAIIGTVAGTDNVVNAQEAAAPIKVAGVAEANAKLKFQIVDSQNKVIDLPNAEATADANGQWTLDMTLPAGLADGKYTLSVTSTNAVGNTATGTREFTVDKTPPAPVSKVTVEGGDLIITNKEAKSGVDVTGTAEPGAKVRVTVAGGKTLEATAGSNGAWKVTLHDTDLPTLNKGASVPGSLAITAEDKAGNVSAEYKQAVTLEGPPVDAKTPTIETPGALGDSYLNSEEAKAPMKISGGGVNAGDKVKVTMGGIALPDATADQNGNWSTTASAAVLGRLTNGPKEIVATAETSQGGMSPAAGKLAFTVDKTPPALVSKVTVEGGNLPITPEKAKSGVDVTGTAEAGAKVRVAVAGGKTLEATAGANGAWKVTLHDTDLPTLQKGATQASQLSITAEDKAGNVSAEYKHTVTLAGSPADAKTPTIETPGALGDSYLNSDEAKAPMKISGGGVNAGDKVKVTMGGLALPDATADQNGNWSTTASTAVLGRLTEGAKEIVATAETSQGGASPAAGKLAFTVDTKPPTLTGLKSDDGTDISAEAAKDGTTFSGKTEQGATVTATWNGKVIQNIPVKGDGSWDYKVPAADMPKPVAGGKADAEFKVTVADKAGNTTEGSLKVTVSGEAKTSAAPTFDKVTDDNVINQKEAAVQVTVSGTAEANTTITLSANGKPLPNKITTSTAGKWTTQVNFADYSDGEVTLSATATPAGGGTASAETQHKVTVDKTPPAAASNIKANGGDTTITAEEAKEGAKLSGDAPLEATKVKVTFNNEITEADVTNGKWNAHFNSVPTAGTADVHAVTLDSAKNEGIEAKQTITVEGVAIPAPSNPIGPNPPSPNGTGTQTGNNPPANKGDVTSTPIDNDTGSTGSTSSTNSGSTNKNSTNTNTSTGTTGSDTTGANGATGTADNTNGAGATPGSASDAGGTAGPAATPGSTAGGTTGGAGTPGNAGSGSATAKLGAPAAANEDAADNDQQGTAVTTPSLKSAGDSSTALVTKSLGGSKLSLADLLDQGSHDGLTLPGTHAPTGAATPTADMADLGNAAAAHSSTSTVNTLLGTQQPWEHQPLV